MSTAPEHHLTAVPVLVGDDGTSSLERFTRNYERATIPLASLVKQDVSGHVFQNRSKVKVDKEAVEALALAIRDGVYLKPIWVTKVPNSDKYYVLDGHHRVAAYIGGGREFVEAFIVRGSASVLTRIAAMSNLGNGMDESYEQRLYLAAVYYNSYSDDEIARESLTDVSTKFRVQRQALHNQIHRLEGEKTLERVGIAKSAALGPLIGTLSGFADEHIEAMKPLLALTKTDKRSVVTRDELQALKASIETTQPSQQLDVVSAWVADKIVTPEKKSGLLPDNAVKASNLLSKFRSLLQLDPTGVLSNPKVIDELKAIDSLRKAAK